MSLEKEMGWKSLTLCHKSRAAAALLFLYLYSPAPQSLCAVMHAIASRGLHLIVKVSYSVQSCTSTENGQAMGRMERC